MADISIIIPAYNEERRLPSTLRAVTAFLVQQPLNAEVVVVDDGSRDGTARLVEEFSASHPNVRLLRNPGNRGKGYAVRHGMLESRGEWRLFSDADLSTPIEELNKLLDAAKRQQVDVALGSRALDRSLVTVRQSAFREASGRFFNVVMRTLTGLPFRDTQCGFKLFRAEAAREVFRRQQIDGFGFDVEALFIARVLGYRAVEVPVRWQNVEGTKVTMANGLNSFADLARVRMHQIKGRYR